MELLRQNFWTIILLAIIVVSLIIVMIFIIINVCISKRAAWYSTNVKSNHYTETNVKKLDKQVYHKEVVNEKPPLPPRDQFLSMESVDQSYEDVITGPDYVMVEGSTPPFTQNCIFTPDYAINETTSQDQDSEDYDDVVMPADSDSEDYDDIG